MGMEYTRNELKVLWHCKRQQGVVENDKIGVVRLLAQVLDMRHSTVGYVLRQLEDKCLIARSFTQRRSRGIGQNVITRVEMVDPEMYLPPLPEPPPLAVVLDQENEELYQRITCEPSTEAVILALLAENEKLRFQIDKLQGIVASQAKELMERSKTSHLPAHLAQRVQDALPADKWEEISHKGKR